MIKHDMQFKLSLTDKFTPAIKGLTLDFEIFLRKLYIKELVEITGDIAICKINNQYRAAEILSNTKRKFYKNFETWRAGSAPSVPLEIIF